MPGSTGIAGLAVCNKESQAHSIANKIEME
jgi:hypothetical protein